MALDLDGLSVISDGASIGTGAGSRKRVWQYVTNNTKAEVETNGYFDALSEKMNTGDAIMIVYDVDGTIGGRWYAVTKTAGDIALTGFFDATGA